MESDNQRVEEGDRLLRWGFREFTDKTLVRQGEKVADADVWFGKQGKVPLVADHDIVLTLPANAQSGIKFILKYTGPIQAPIAKGAHIADLVIKVPETEPQVVPLVAGQDVDKLSGLGRIIAAAKYYLHHKKQ